MPKELMWKWFEVKICVDENTAAQYYADPSNRGKFCCSMGGMPTKKVWLPHLIYLVRDIAIAKGQRMPWEVRNYAIQLSVSASASFKGESLALLKDYTMAACQCKEADKKKSLLTITLASAMLDTMSFQR